MNQKQLNAQYEKIGVMNINELTLFMQKLSLSEIAGKAKEYILRAVENRQLELRDTVDAMAVSSSIKID